MSTPKRVSIEDVYDIDFQNRSSDKMFWDGLFCALKPAVVVEAGCGTGRVLSNLCERAKTVVEWHGIDLSQKMINVFNERHKIPGFRICGDIVDQWAWRDVSSSPISDLTIIPYSTLFLVPHNSHVKVLQNAMSATKSGGFVAVEVFIPRQIRTSIEVHMGGCGNPYGDLDDWSRKTTYTVCSSTRVTHIVRQYGPHSVAGGFVPEFVVEEDVFWVEPNRLLDLAFAAGSKSAKLDYFNDVADGHVVLLMEA